MIYIHVEVDWFLKEKGKYMLIALETDTYPVISVDIIMNESATINKIKLISL